MYVPSRVMVPGDLAATAANLVSNAPLFRMGLASDLLIVLIEVVLTVLLYVLLRPVSAAGALVAAFARLGMTVVQGVNVVFHATALKLALGGAGAGGAAAAGGVPAGLGALLDAHTVGGRVWVVLFALHCAALAWLLVRSGFFPRALGWLMALAALGYLVDGFGHLVLPAFPPGLVTATALAAMVGELPFVFWLMWKGVDPAAWWARAGATLPMERAGADA